MTLAWRIVVCLVVSVPVLYVVQSQDTNEFPCYALSRDNYTCDACIRQHPSCAWCKLNVREGDKNPFSKHSRCDSAARLKQHGCPLNDIQDPKTKLLNEQTLDKPVSDAVSGHDAVMLSPQRLSIKLRPHDKYTFTVKYRQAKDYPVDLYYLMDLSFSMSDDKDNLAKLGSEIAKRMRSITKNFQLGFGSFVDKALIPFVDPRPEKRDYPCENEPTCSPPYGYRHEMTLSDNDVKFAARVKNSRISGNLDAPEGGFDALMQSLACEGVIGWRNNSRKMIVFSTDAGFHYAGDGRLAGVVMPNDAQCHMIPTGNGDISEYSMTGEQDYPSIAQLHKIIREKKANIIFAVTNEMVPLYNRLKSSLRDVSASVGELRNDSSNVVELIYDAYNKIAQKVVEAQQQPTNQTSQIIMVDNADTAGTGLKFSYRTRCLEEDGELEVKNWCDNVRINDLVEYEVTVEHVQCQAQGKNTYDIQIGPSGLTDVLTLEVEVECECECAREGAISRPGECSSRGRKICGVCACDAPYIGNNCECDSSSIAASTTAELDRACRRYNESEVCEGRGTCVCGRCECFPRPNPDEKVTGQFCECNNYGCKRDPDTGRLCSGNGQCVCGSCKCNPGWEGMRCDCPTSTEGCMNNGKMCSNRGRCTCGSCKCDPRYTGRFCEDCKTCPNKCIEYRPCVLCQTWQKGPYNETLCEETKNSKECPFEVIVVDELPLFNQSETNCSFVDERDCRYYFQYLYDEDRENATVYVKREMDCPPPVPIIAIILGLIAGIVLIGLILLLVWKLLTMLHDRREFAAFEQERLMARWDTGENPIFTPATSTFKNPAYAGRQ